MGMKKQSGFTSVELLVFVIILAGIGGWIAHVVKLVGLLGGDITVMFVARVVGVFAAPLGAVLGFV